MVFIHIRTNLKNSLGSIWIDRNASQHLLPVEGILIPSIDFSYACRAASGFVVWVFFQREMTQSRRYQETTYILRTYINGSTNVITQNF